MVKLLLKIVDLMIMLPFHVRYFCYKRIYDIDRTFVFNGSGTKFYGNGKIIVGKHSYCGTNCYFQARRGQVIKIGDNCAISHNVRIYTANRDPQQVIKGKEKAVISGDVVLGENVWVGANVFVRQGVVIGDNCVIGANSVVTKDVESGSIIAGVPAKLLYKV